MKSKWKQNPFFHIFVFLSALILMGSIIAIGLFYYFFSIPEPEGLSLATWPNRFTRNFSTWLECESGAVRVKEIGLDYLDEYGLWLQVLDDSGQEIFSYNKPESCPTSYRVSELITVSTSKYENGNTLFISSVEVSGETWNYIIGFPYAIGKYMLYYNGENVGRLSPMLRMVIFIALFSICLFILAYCFWLTHHLGRIAKGIDSVSLRTYQPLKKGGVFGNIYEALNKLDKEIRHSDQVQSDTDRARNEWIANITHDLKTPLSPVKGYAELLADNSATDSQTAQEYGSIILKNINHAEKLINDLKLTYQLDSGAFPFYPQEVRLIRYLKELVIDIANDPAFSSRSIEFESGLPEFSVMIDPDLFRRAIQNLVINALVHNPPDTKVNVSIIMGAENSAFIFIRDNGTGMSDTEQAELFTRYYRGTNTKEKAEGSGLGLAIAKQIISLHGGDISVKSKLGEGTEFAIQLPAN